MSGHFARSILSSRGGRNIVLSGPSGFLGSRVVDEVVKAQALRKAKGLPPGQLILLSGSPGKLMANLSTQYSREAMSDIRASRVDYYVQHDSDDWVNHMGSLGLQGESSVFINLAAVAGPVSGFKDAMYDVNYKACKAAAEACAALKFAHFIQASTQATVTGKQVERGQATFLQHQLQHCHRNRYTYCY